MRKIALLLVLSGIIFNSVLSQKVDSIKVEQSGDFIKVRYKILDSRPDQVYSVKVLCSINGGLNQSVFFQYLIRNLKENPNDYLPSEELFSKMKLAVMNNSPTVPQFGTIQNVGDEGGDFIFIKRKAGKITGNGPNVVSMYLSSIWKRS